MPVKEKLITSLTGVFLGHMVVDDWNRMTLNLFALEGHSFLVENGLQAAGHA